MTPNDYALVFKNNLETDQYEKAYSDCYEAYKKLIMRWSFQYGQYNEDMNNHFVSLLPKIVAKWNPERSSFSTYLSLNLKGNEKLEFKKDNAPGLNRPKWVKNIRKTKKERVFNPHEIQVMPIVYTPFEKKREEDFRPDWLDVYSRAVYSDTLDLLILEEQLSNLTEKEIAYLNKPLNKHQRKVDEIRHRILRK